MREKVNVNRYGRNPDGSVSFLGIKEETASKVSHMSVLDETCGLDDGAVRRMVAVVLLNGDTYLTDIEGRAAIVTVAALQH